MAPLSRLRRSWPALAGCCLLALLLLGGCAPSAALGAAQMVAGLAGGSEGQTIRPGTGVQNGRYQDDSIRQALNAANREPLSACRARLPERSDLEPGQCGLTAVCLPGAASPTELYVCTPPDDAAWTRAAAQSSSVEKADLVE